ncbi:DUF2892 domain-containing protein [Metabacillus sp. GX 13764]|uniref:YgaP family membrane protein n=1 Tax=Metabacillus kandeliae TaxID=2900151 RepID=UPI001E56B260|nr:DUF2892 domain-containing protein [Metabacillus kandeliae]MCD7034407.1 DUF2892 domain-containing protein [Metabacillus kandeliae]
MVKPNIGIVNALIRITIGMTIVSIAGARYTKRPGKESLILLIMLGAMKVGEGILRFCPVTFMVQKAAQAKEDTGHGSESYPGPSTYNPS